GSGCGERRAATPKAIQATAPAVSRARSKYPPWKKASAEGPASRTTTASTVIARRTSVTLDDRVAGIRGARLLQIPDASEQGSHVPRVPGDARAAGYELRPERGRRPVSGSPGEL